MAQFPDKNPAKRVAQMALALSETRIDLAILRGSIADAEKTQPRWAGMTEEVGKWIARIDAALAKAEA